MDQVEESLPSAQEKHKQEEGPKGKDLKEDEAERVEGDDDDAADEEELGDDSEHDGGGEQEDEAIPKPAGKKKKGIPFAAKSKEKKQDEVLNLNNEVVLMRKEVKRVRVLIIRKVTRQMVALKKKKGKDVEVEKNQRRAARLLEEVHAMKTLSPDLVTKTALQKDLDFEQVCKNPKSTISDRAITRIATHPQFKKKIEAIKAAVEAFKEERLKGGKPGGREKVQNKAGKVTLQSPEEKEAGKTETTEENAKVEQKESFNKEQGEEILQDPKEATVAQPEKKAVEASPSGDTAGDQRKKTPKAKNVQLASIKSSEVKDIVRDKPQASDPEKEPELKSAPKLLEKKEEEEESDLEASDDEEKEYFDDSTEERFNKQSSQSEESDDDDNGFFVGKVSKFKKKKKQKSVGGDEANERREGDPPDQVQSELDELETRLKSKATTLQSVFCSSLSSPKLSRGRGAGRGRGGDRFGGHAGLHKQEKEAERNPRVKYSNPSSESFSSGGRGRGRGRGGGAGRGRGRGGGVFTHQEPQQALHPSWEASKKRKEQQGQILAFQGKKIKFDD